jgi:hypothetical protein
MSSRISTEVVSRLFKIQVKTKEAIKRMINNNVFNITGVRVRLPHSQ